MIGSVLVSLGTDFLECSSITLENASANRKALDYEDPLWLKYFEENATLYFEACFPKDPVK